MVESYVSIRFEPSAPPAVAQETWLLCFIGNVTHMSDRVRVS
jgi:hypothetical protein